MNLVQLLPVNHSPDMVGAHQTKQQVDTEGGSFLELLLNSMPCDVLNDENLGDTCDTKYQPPEVLRRLLSATILPTEGIVQFPTAQGCEVVQTDTANLHQTVQTVDSITSTASTPIALGTEPPVFSGEIIHTETQRTVEYQAGTIDFQVAKTAAHPPEVDRMVRVPIRVEHNTSETSGKEAVSTTAAKTPDGAQTAMHLQTVEFQALSAQTVNFPRPPEGKLEENYTVASAVSQKAETRSAGLEDTKPISIVKNGEGVKIKRSESMPYRTVLSDKSLGTEHVDAKGQTDIRLNFKFGEILHDKKLESEDTPTDLKSEAVLDTAGLIFEADKNLVKISDTASRISNQMSSPAVDIANTITVNMQKGKSEFEMQLQPEQLGKIKVKLISENGRVNIEITASNPRTQSLLATSTEEIKTILTNHGLKVNGFDINQTEPDYLDNQPERHSEQHGQHAQQQNRKEQHNDQFNTAAFLALVNQYST